MPVVEIIVFKPSQDFQENAEAASAKAVAHLKGVPEIKAQVVILDYLDAYVNIRYHLRSYRGLQHDGEAKDGIKKAVWVNGGHSTRSVICSYLIS